MNWSDPRTPETIRVLEPLAAPDFYGSGAKARTILGCQPRYTMFDIIDEAVKKG